MSLSSWKQEFYPSRASTTPCGSACAHARRKWVGMLPHNLKRHGCRIDEDNAGIWGEEGYAISISTRTCALCVHYLDRASLGACIGCPLDEVVGIPCGRAGDDSDPWSVFSIAGDVRPMVLALTEAEAWHTYKRGLVGDQHGLDCILDGYLYTAAGGSSARNPFSDKQPVQLARMDEASLVTAIEDCRKFMVGQEELISSLEAPDLVQLGSDFWVFRNCIRPPTPPELSVSDDPDICRTFLEKVRSFPILTCELVDGVLFIKPVPEVTTEKPCQ